LIRSWLSGKHFLNFSPLGCYMVSIARWSNDFGYSSISSLIDVNYIILSMKNCSSFSTSFKILAVHAFTIFRAEDIGLEALTILLEATRFLAVTSFIVLSYNLSFTFLCSYKTLKCTTSTKISPKPRALSTIKKPWNWILREFEEF